MLFAYSLNSLFFLDIDHLTRVLVLCGTPTQETIEKITSQEVFEFYCSRLMLLYYVILNIKELRNLFKYC